MVSSTFHQIQNIFLNWNVLYAVLFEKQMYNSGNFNGKNRWINKKVTVLKKLLPHLATRGTYSPEDWRCDEAWCEQTLVYPPLMCQQRLIYCTWELNVMHCSMHMISMFANCEIQLDGNNPYLTKLQISEWSTFDCGMKRSRIEPKEILTRWWSNMYRSETAFCHKIFSIIRNTNNIYHARVIIR